MRDCKRKQTGGRFSLNDHETEKGWFRFGSVEPSHGARPRGAGSVHWRHRCELAVPKNVKDGLLKCASFVIFSSFPVNTTSDQDIVCLQFPLTHIISHFVHLPSCHAISSLLTRKTERNQAYTQYALGVAEPPFFPSIKDNCKCVLWGEVAKLVLV